MENETDDDCNFEAMQTLVNEIIDEVLDMTATLMLQGAKWIWRYIIERQGRTVPEYKGDRVTIHFVGDV